MHVRPAVHLAAIAAGLVATLTAAPALAQDSGDALSLGGRLVVGGFGRFGFEGTEALAATKPTIGASIVIDKPVADIFAIGGAFEVHSWGVRDGGRSGLIDLMVRPRLRTVYDDTLEFALVLPIGGFLSILSEEAWGSSDIAPGWSIGLRPQARIHVGGVIVEVEAGWHRRAAAHEFFGSNVDVFMNEVVLASGVSFPL